MNIQDIKKLLEIFDNSSSVKLKITNDNFEISLEKSGNKIPKQAQILAPNVISNSMIPNEVAVAQTAVPDEQANSSIAQNKPSNTDTITSPIVGTFYRAPSPDSAPYVNVGDKVKKGQTIAIIEAMKIMNEIEAEFDCKIVEIVASDAQSVEFSTPLFIVEKI